MADTQELLDTVHFAVEFHDGTDPEDEGMPYFVASCLEFTIVTGGESFEELMTNIRDALGLFLKDEDTVAEYNVIPAPRIVLNVEMAYAPVA